MIVGRLPSAGLCLLAISLVGEAQAQVAGPEAIAPAKLQLQLLEKRYRRARAQRNVGIGLTVPGVMLCIVGAELIAYGSFDPNLVGGAAEITSGALSAGVGLAFAIPGLVLWTRGQDAMDVAVWRSRQQLPQIQEELRR